LSIKLCELIARDPKALRHINWRQLEEVVATALEGLGFHVELTAPSKDGGRDVIANCIIKGKWSTHYIELKHWRSGKMVGQRQVFDFIEVNVKDRTDGGLFISTSGYSESVWSHLSELAQYRVQLGNKETLVTLCQRFSRLRNGVWHAVGELPQILYERTINGPMA
jgi:restriction endonuclease Mrr